MAQRSGRITAGGTFNKEANGFARSAGTRVLSPRRSAASHWLSVASLTPSATAACFWLRPISRSLALKSVLMRGHFSLVEFDEASSDLRPSRILQCGFVPLIGLRRFLWGMTSLPETPEERALRLQLQLSEQRTMLEHLPQWIKLRGLRQKDIAVSMGVSEATISGWIRGMHGMSVGQLRQMAVILRADPGDLLQAPSEAGTSKRVEETLSLMDRLSESEWDAIMQNARLLAEAKRRD
jgi:transcriptional regulator with XRE-family HTH domain